MICVYIVVHFDRHQTRHTDMTTLTLLCGLLCDNAAWEAQAQALQQDHDVRIVHFAGFDSITAMARHVLETTPGTFALAGHSMGGRVALEVYRQAPERIERLALLDTGYEGVSEGEEERRAVLVNRALRDGIGAIAADWALPMLAPHRRHDKTLVDQMLAMVNRMSGTIYAGQTRALLGRPDATPVLASITCPTLVLCGQQDGWSPPHRHEVMAAMIPGARLRLIDDCGHMAMMEQPDAILQAMQEWLAIPAALQHPA